MTHKASERACMCMWTEGETQGLGHVCVCAKRCGEGSKPTQESEITSPSCV